MADLIYYRIGLFTYFYPKTKDGEYVFNEMKGEPILTIYEKNVLAQIRKAGYSVRKKSNRDFAEELSDSEIEELLKLTLKFLTSLSREYPKRLAWMKNQLVKAGRIGPVRLG